MSARRATVLVDTREQLPLLFPRTIKVDGKGRLIQVQKVRLEAGDYALKGAEHAVIIERKGSASEVCKNMLDLDDRRRQLAAFDRLAAACRLPILLLEGTPGHLLSESRYAPDPGRAFDALVRELMRRGIHLWLVGQCKLPARRRLVGELCLRLLLAGAEIYG